MLEESPVYVSRLPAVKGAELVTGWALVNPVPWEIGEGIAG
jgi:hypothetical protein